LRTYFRFSGGLDSGGVVRYGGLAVGKITQVRVDPGDSARIEIDFAVDPGAPVKKTALHASRPWGLLSENFLEISPGAPTSARPRQELNCVQRKRWASTNLKTRSAQCSLKLKRL